MCFLIVGINILFRFRSLSLFNLLTRMPPSVNRQIDAHSSEPKAKISGAQKNALVHSSIDSFTEKMLTFLKLK